MKKRRRLRDDPDRIAYTVTLGSKHERIECYGRTTCALFLSGRLVCEFEAAPQQLKKIAARSGEIEITAGQIARALPPMLQHGRFQARTS